MRPVPSWQMQIVILIKCYNYITTSQALTALTAGGMKGAVYAILHVIQYMF